MSATQERAIEVRSGWTMLLLNLGLFFGGIALSIVSVALAVETSDDYWLWLLAFAIPAFISSLISIGGYFTLQPNEGSVLILFGDYRGTVRNSGFHWANPFLTKTKISLRARNFDGDQLKVNDERGNPIEISAVVVWRVVDTSKAVFDVDDYEHFVKVQSESAVRHVAKDYPYDHGEDGSSDEVTLRSGVDEVSEALKRQIQERLVKAGVEVEEARLNHLAYAPEIAGAMLRRQQAEAIIAARKKIVHGAVSMVQMALKDLADNKVVELDEERKASMVSNLLVVLCGESEVHPVVNTGTLYG